MPQKDRYRERIVPIEYNEYEDFKNLPTTDRVTLSLISNGRLNVILNNEAVTFEAPCMVLLSFYDSVRIIEQNRLSAASFSFNPVFLNSALTFDALKENKFIETEDEHDRNMLNLFLKRNENYKGSLDLSPQVFLRVGEWLSIIGKETFAQSDGMWTCRIRRFLLQTLYLLDDVYMGLNDVNKQKPEKSPVSIVLEFIHTNYQDNLKLEDFCTLVHTNRTTLNKLFKKQTEHTVMDYLLFHRIRIACEALTHTNLTISEIAEASGFKYDTYFTKRFAVKMGMSPTEYRNTAWNK